MYREVQENYFVESIMEKKKIVKVAHAIHDFKSVMKLYILHLSL